MAPIRAERLRREAGKVIVIDVSGQVHEVPIEGLVLTGLSPFVVPMPAGGRLVARTPGETMVTFHVTPALHITPMEGTRFE